MDQSLLAKYAKYGFDAYADLLNVSRKSYDA